MRRRVFSGPMQEAELLNFYPQVVSCFSGDGSGPSSNSTRRVSAPIFLGLATLLVRFGFTVMRRWVKSALKYPQTRHSALPPSAAAKRAPNRSFSEQARRWLKDEGPPNVTPPHGIN